MLGFIIVVQFQSQRPNGRIIREQRLFGDNPNMACEAKNNKLDELKKYLNSKLVKTCLHLSCCTAQRP